MHNTNLTLLSSAYISKTTLCTELFCSWLLNIELFSAASPPILTFWSHYTIVNCPSRWSVYLSLAQRDRYSNILTTHQINLLSTTHLHLLLLLFCQGAKHPVKLSPITARSPGYADHQRHFLILRFSLTDNLEGTTWKSYYSSSRWTLLHH